MDGALEPKIFILLLLFILLLFSKCDPHIWFTFTFTLKGP